MSTRCEGFPAMSLGLVEFRLSTAARATVMVALLLGAVQFACPAAAQRAAGVGQKTDQAVRSYITAHQRDLLAEFEALLSIPNVARDTANIRRNAQWLQKAIEGLGGHSQLLEAGGSPAVFGEWITPSANFTVLFYAHYDGQPTRVELWAGAPWTPVIRADGRPESATIDLRSTTTIDPSWRVFARSTSDDKGGVFGILTAIRVLRTSGIVPSMNIKAFFEGEEEASSPTLEKIIASNPELLRSDLVLFCDGPAHPSGKLSLSFGTRGEVNLEITTFGPSHPVHSGHYGNWAPNPAARLARLLASMRDDDGRILIHGYYDSVIPPTPAELQAIAAIPSTDAELRRELNIRPESPARIEEAALWPTLNIKGIRSGQVGIDAPYVIPSEATAEIDLRIVPNQVPDEVKRLVEAHVRAAGFYITHDVPTEEELRQNAKVVWLAWADNGYPALRTPVGDKTSTALLSVVKNTLGEELMIYPADGAGLPLYYFKKYLNAPVITLSVANYDNHQHAPNENIAIGYLWRGIRVYAAIMVELSAEIQAQAHQ